MAHKSLEELDAALQIAMEQVEIGGTYAHYKHPDRHYRVTDLGIIEETEEVGVIYKALYGEKTTFIRPLESWMAHVSWQGVAVPRFTRIS